MSRISLEQLAIHGGPKTKTTPYGEGQRFAGNELKYLKDALEQGTLFYGSPRAKWVKRACEMMKSYTGMPYVVACTSGSAAIHLGLVAAGIGPGDEVITTPNTDSGTTLGIIEEGAIPIFCDPDYTMQPTAESIAKKITPRTKAVVIVHLAGDPAPMHEIVALCKTKKIAVVEDCAQAWGAKLNGQIVGSFADAGCYSTNDFKHISTGDGGFVALRDAELYRRVSNYSDKHYDRLFKNERFQHHHGINYRMTELQGAVAVAQLEKVDSITNRQHAMGERMRELLKDLRGGRMTPQVPGAYGTYWWGMLLIDPKAVRATRDELVAAINAEGAAVSSAGRYDLIQAELYQKRNVRPWLPSPQNQYPFVQPDGRDYHYDTHDLPRHKNILDVGIRLMFNFFFTDQDIEETAAAIQKVFAAYRVD